MRKWLHVEPRSVYIPKELFPKVKKVVAIEETSLSGLIVKLLREYVNQEKYKMLFEEVSEK